MMGKSYLLRASLKFFLAASTGAAALMIMPPDNRVFNNSIHRLLAAETEGGNFGNGRKICRSTPYPGSKSICIYFDTTKNDKVDLDVEKKLREIGLKAFPSNTRTYSIHASEDRITHYFFCPKATGVLCLEDLGNGLNMISIIPTKEKISPDMPVLENLSDGGLAFLDGQDLAVIDSNETINVFNLSGALLASKGKNKSEIDLKCTKSGTDEEIIVITVKSKKSEKKYGFSRLTRELFEME